MNWKKIIKDLREVYTAAFLSDYLSVDLSMISRLRMGALSEPRYSVGAHLVTLWLSLHIGEYADIELESDNARHD